MAKPKGRTRSAQAFERMRRGEMRLMSEVGKREMPEDGVDDGVRKKRAPTGQRMAGG